MTQRTDARKRAPSTVQLLPMKLTRLHNEMNFTPLRITGEDFGQWLCDRSPKSRGWASTNSHQIFVLHKFHMIQTGEVGVDLSESAALFLFDEVLQLAQWLSLSRPRRTGEGVFSSNAM